MKNTTQRNTYFDSVSGRELELTQHTLGKRQGNSQDKLSLRGGTYTQRDNIFTFIIVFTSHWDVGGNRRSRETQRRNYEPHAERSPAKVAVKIHTPKKV